MTSNAILQRYPELRRAFLKHLARYGNMAAALAHCRLTKSMLTDTMDKDETFSNLVQQAKDEHASTIDEAIRKRAIEGWEEPRFNAQGIVGHVTRYSDQLLLAYAKRHMPEYRDTSTSTNHLKVDATVEHKHKVDIQSLTADQRTALRLLLGTPTDGPTLPAITVEPAE